MLRKIFISFGHAVLLVVLHLIYFNLNWSLPLEFEMMMMMNKVESFAGGRGNFDEKKYFFINTAYDVVLTETETEYGETGKVPVRLTVAFADPLQPLLLITVTETRPAVFILVVCVVARLLHK